MWAYNLSIDVPSKNALSRNADAIPQPRSSYPNPQHSMLTLTPPCCRKRNQKSLSSVRSAVVKKPPLKRKSLRPSKCNAAQSAENPTPTLKAPRRSKRIADLQDEWSRFDIESTPLRRPQSAARAKVVHANKGRQSVSNVNSKWQSTSRSKCRKTSQQSPPGVTRTRSGRETKRPRRLGLDLASTI